MKIEVGKFYKTRNGRKVRIYAIDGQKEHPVHGAICDSQNNEWYPDSWSFNGEYSRIFGDPLSIVAEWEEPKPKLKAWICKNSGTSMKDTVGMVLFSKDGLVSFNGQEWQRAEWLDEK